MHSAKRTQNIGDACPHSLNRVDVNFADTVTLLIACLFILAVIDRRMLVPDGCSASIHPYAQTLARA